MKKILIIFFICIMSITAYGEERNMQEKRIKMTFNNQESVILMDNNQAAEQFLAMLPGEFKFSDFNRKEKITYFPKPIDLSGAKGGMTATKGKLFIYAPWGNMGIFYRDHSNRPDNDLIQIGIVESGIENIGAQNSDFTARIELIK